MIISKLYLKLKTCSAQNVAFSLLKLKWSSLYKICIVVFLNVFISNVLFANSYKESIDSANTLAWENAEENTFMSLEAALWAHASSVKNSYSEGIAFANLDLGLISLLTGDIEKSLEQTLAAINLTNNSKTKVLAQNQLGRIYNQLADFEQSKKYLLLAITYNKKENNFELLAGNYINYGNLQENIFELDSAYYYYNSALKIGKEKKYDNIVVAALNNLGSLNGLLNDIEAEQKNYIEALDYTSETSVQYAQISYNLAVSCFALGQLDKAKIYAETSLEISDKNNFTLGKKNATNVLGIIAESNGDFKNALIFQKQFNEFSQQIINENTSKKITQIQLVNDFGQQLKLDSIAKVEEINKINEANEKKELVRQAQIKQRNIILVFALIILLGVIYIAFRFFKIGKERQKTNEIISEQKVEVEKQRDIATEMHAIAEEQKKIVEHKNEEIIESITYAKRLQEAILPPPKLVKEWLTDSFILYKPKDIVAGDFYWMETTEVQVGEYEKTMIFFAAADCTGHGVPGALVSVVCANALNRSIKEFQIKSTGDILDKVSDLVIESFEKGEEIIKDGMDIALCALDVSSRKLYFSGAHNPLWIISSKSQMDIDGDYKTMANDDETIFLHEIKASKQPVGQFETRKNFETIEINLNFGDQIYLSSDGYPDQFGGPNGKKYKSLNFKKFLLNSSVNEMHIQKEKLSEEFENWKGDLEQVDDVCVIGVKINDSDFDLFTARELEVLQLIKEGLSSKMIGDKMNISKHTVDTYRRRLLAKSGTHNAAELLKFGDKNRLI